MTEKKITKKEFYAGIIEAMQTGNSPIAPDEVIAFCENEIALLDKKAEKAKARAAAKRAEGDELTDAVLAALTDELTPIGDSTEKVAFEGEISNAKVEYRLNQLVNRGDAVTEQVIVGEDKRKLQAYKLANADS
jgi:hypothetical protein